MVEIGLITETIQGKVQHNYKVRLSWELPDVMRVFDETKGPQPSMFHKEYTLSLGKKANLRKALDAWRGVAFTETEVKDFDITKLVGVPCLLNLIHRTSQSSGNQYEELASITPVPKGMKVPGAINPYIILSYDAWNEEVFKALPEFLQDKIMSSKEYDKMRFPGHAKKSDPLQFEDNDDNNNNNVSSDLPF